MLNAAASDLGYGSLRLGDTAQTTSLVTASENLQEANDVATSSDGALRRNKKEVEHTGKFLLSVLSRSMFSDFHPHRIQWFRSEMSNEKHGGSLKEICEQNARNELSKSV